VDRRPEQLAAFDGLWPIVGFKEAEGLREGRRPVGYDHGDDNPLPPFERSLEAVVSPLDVGLGGLHAAVPQVAGNVQREARAHYLRPGAMPLGVWASVEHSCLPIRQPLSHQGGASTSAHVLFKPVVGPLAVGADRLYVTVSQVLSHVLKLKARPH